MMRGNDGNNSVRRYSITFAAKRWDIGFVRCRHIKTGEEIAQIN